MEEQNKKLTKSEHNKIYRQNNKERIRQYRNEYYHKNKEKIKEQNKANYQKNIEKHKERNKIASQKYAETNKIRYQLYRKNNREELLAKDREYYQKNKKQILQKQKEQRIAKKQLLLEERKQNPTIKKPRTPRACPIRKEYTEAELQDLVKQYKNQTEKFWCPLTNKVYSTYSIWIVAFGIRMAKPCINRFMFLLQEPHYSKYSGKLLTEEEFSYSETYKGWTGFKKYTLEEVKQKVWTKLVDYSFAKTPEHRKLLSERGKEFNQTEKGIQRRNEKSKKMQDFYQTEEGKAQKAEASKKNSITMKRLIAEGVFTPPITNTWTHWNAQIVTENGIIKKFRSSWEACFYDSNPHLEYESIRVRENAKTFVNDFFDNKTNTVYEIKPRSRYNIEIDKMNALQNFCIKNGFKFIWINENNIIDYIDVEKTLKHEKNKEQALKMLKDPTIKKKYESKYTKN